MGRIGESLSREGLEDGGDRWREAEERMEMGQGPRRLMLVRRDDDQTTTKRRPVELPADAFRAVADYTYDWESWHDSEGELLWVNPAVERITGWSVEECFEMRDYPLPIAAPGCRRRLSRVLALARRGEPGENVEFCILRRDGDYRWMSLAWQPMNDESRQLTGFRTSIRDITERYQLREQLERSAEELERLVDERTMKLLQLEKRQRQMEKMAAIGQLAAGIAHEINNPLAGMRSAFELFRSGVDGRHEQYELLELIDREIERIGLITHQMHQLYRDGPHRAAEFELSQAIAEIVRLMEGLAAKRGVALTYDATDAPPTVTLPEGEVRQILLNIVRNAIQASPVGGEAAIRVSLELDEVTIEVRDNGPGIPAAELPRIFDPFFTTKHGQEEPGMGLGLSVSQSLIESMGGRIEVESLKPHGTLFKAIFPQRLVGNAEST